MSKYAQHTSYTQLEQAPGTVKNNGGGYSFQLNKWKQLDRFLILGSEGGTYYVSERKLTKENITCIDACIKEDPIKTVKRIVEISNSGRAHKNAPAVFALALCAASTDALAKHEAMQSLSSVCRQSTDLFSFISDVQSMRGWGYAFKKAVARWYLSKTPDALAYQLVKYRQRDGWTHKDAIRLSHPKAHKALINNLLAWAVDKYKEDMGGLPDLISDFLELQTCPKEKDVVRLIKRNRSLTWEMVPTEMHTHATVWQALLPNMPLNALIRNLGRMTANGALKELSDEVGIIREKLLNEEYLKKSRVHPMTILNALMVYKHGRSTKGATAWRPLGQINQILNDAFYLSFKTIEPMNKNILLALDVSASMGSPMGENAMTCREATAAMALVTARTEKNHIFKMFQSRLTDCPIISSDTLDSAVRKISDLPFGSTNCAAPILWATTTKTPVDLFVIYTDNETNNPSVHPNKALEDYRQATGRSARMAVVGMTATQFTISDPNNPNCLDVVGFDTDTPNVIAAFGRGEI